MNPFLSWGIIFVAVGGYWLFNSYKKSATINIQSDKRSTGGVYVGSGPKTTDTEKKKKRKKANQQAKKSNVEVLIEKAPETTTADGEEDDVAEEDAAEMVRRLAQLRSGKPATPAVEQKKAAPQKFVKQRSAQEKLAPKPPSSPLATASQASSAGVDTGADADVDDESAAENLLGASHDPSDMLEAPAPGPRVLTITPSTAPPRVPKAKSVRSNTSETGAQYTKNQKKKEKARAAKEAEKAAQEAAREKYRAEQRAEGIMSTRERQRAFKAGDNDAWTVAGQKSRPQNLTAKKSEESSLLLDTFESTAPANIPDFPAHQKNPQPQAKAPSTSRNDIPSNLDNSVWEDVPKSIMDEQEWNTVPVKKKGSSVASGSKSTTPAASTTNVAAKGKSRLNGFEALGSSASEWAEVEPWDEKAW